MKKYYLLIAPVLLLCALWLTPLQADDPEEKENIAIMAVITAKDGHDDALIKAITDYHKWVAKFEGSMRFHWWHILTGPDTGKYVARSGGHSWADFDAEYEWQEEAGEVFEKNVAPHIAHMEQVITSEMSEYSNWPDNWDGYDLVWTEQWYVKNGQGAKFRKGLKRIVDTLKAGGFPNYFGFHSVVSGGHGNQVSFVSPRKGWADMSEKNPSFGEIMMKEFGSEEEMQNFMSDWAATFKTGVNAMGEYMPEASDYGDG
jgi:hypothetical protein